MRRRAEELLGGSIESRLRHALDARASVVEENGRFSLRLDTVDDGVPGQRNLESASCDELASATALIVALAVDPSVASRATTNTPNDVAATAPATPPPPAPAAAATTPAGRESVSPPPAPRREKVRIDGSVEAGVAADLGALPGFAVGPSLSGAIGIDRVRLRLGATYFAPRFADAQDATSHGSRGADVSLLVGTLSGCYAIVTRVQVSACGDFEAGALFAAGKGFQVPRDSTNPWLAAGASAEVTVGLAGPLTLRAGLGAMFPFGRSRVQSYETTANGTATNELHRPFWVSGRGTLALGLRF